MTERAKLPDIDDVTLMLQARDDNEAAFAELVRRHQKKVLNYFTRTGVQYDCEDLVQQTFLRLYRYRKRYVASAKFTTFLFLLARQVWIDELRRRKRHQRLIDELSAEALAGQPAPMAVHSAVAGSMDLAQALASLPEGLRQVVELGVYQDLPYEEVSKILGIPVGTVKSRMFNALKKLREFMEKR
ncbi:MAG: RNA polymerase sigma factor [Kiritimatiellae bacterium]|nr:RNA polymerase sigma factor [Kiritimatiellia bacterium]